jgi:rSAM/selenodomain-associated transferase 1
VTGRPRELSLCIFARSPQLGSVKRRLAAEIGAAAALEVYRELAEDTLRRLAALDGVRSELWLAGPVNAEVLAWLQRWRLPLRSQQGADLGERMANALAACHGQGCAGLVVGTDCPPVDGAYVREAERALENHDVVLGPAEDGGYALVGTRVPTPGIFRDVPWGSASVLDITLARIAAAGVSVALLETVWDVDTAEDLARFRATAPGRPSGRPQDH